MMTLIIKWLSASAAIFLAPYVIPGISIANFYTALVATLLFGILNITVRPLLLLLTLPINLITLGLFTFILNAFIFWSLSTVVKGFEIDGFIPALLGSLFVSVVLFITDKLFNRD